MRKIRKILAGFLAGCLLLGGCSSTEVEDREFPTLLMVSSEKDFSSEWLNGLQQGSKKVDYNHLKVILIERGFLEDEAAMAEMLGLLKEDKNVPLNAYVVTTDAMEALKEADTAMDMPLGDYLEDMLEQGDSVKKETYPTIGMLYQEAENQKETLFIPSISLAEGKPEITAYEAYKRGRAEGLMENDIALLSFFVNNQMKEYVLKLGVNNYVRLSNTSNEISLGESRGVNGLLKKQVLVKINCEGKILRQTYGEDKEAVEKWLAEQLQEYMTAKAQMAKEKGIDVTNSFKKLGSEREWYLYYTQSPDFYEEDMEVAFEIKVNWID